MDIHLRSIPHKKHRYETVGDWRTDTEGMLRDVLVSEMPADYEFLVGLHELIEGWLCAKRGVTDAEVTQFDEIFEAMRSSDDVFSEPGDDPRAPYFKEHRFATRVERLMAKELGVNWKYYEETIAAL